MLKVISEREYNEIFKRLDILGVVSPFQSSEVSTVVSSVYDRRNSVSVVPVFFSLFEESELVAVGLLFSLTRHGSVHLVSGGRFGYAGLYVFKKCDISDALGAINSYAKRMKALSCSVSISFGIKPFDIDVEPSWRVTNLKYLLADIDQCCSNGNLVFHKAITRSSVSRGIKQSETNGIHCKVSQDEQTVREWYERCHLERIKEISGRAWPIEIFMKLADSGSGKLAVAYQTGSRDIKGGCFYLQSRAVLELFMMSTPRVSQTLGVNYALTKFLYLTASREELSFVNWQASNPPTGSLVAFKRNWNADDFDVHIFSRKYDYFFPDDTELREVYPDFYVYPYQ
jgi:hypothetical protein